MARSRRHKSEAGFYHIMLRGNERRVIFHEDADKARFIETLRKVRLPEKPASPDDSSNFSQASAPSGGLLPRFNLHAYCLMDNHIHLMLSQGSEDISTAIKRISVSYVAYFNKKYNRVGHLFQDRYRSEIVNGEAYLLALSRYIHLNPVNAGIVINPQDYPWSSLAFYLRTEASSTDLVDTSLVLNLFSEDRAGAAKEYQAFLSEKIEAGHPENFIDVDDRPELTEAEAIKRGEALYAQLLQHIATPDNCKPAQIPPELIQDLKRQTNLSLRKLAQITGLNKDKIRRMLEEA